MKINRIPLWAQSIIERLKSDEDVSVTITGPKGGGKSTLTIWLMLWTQAYYTNGVVEVDPLLECLTWEASEWLSKLRPDYSYQAIGFEEFGNAVSVEEINSIINEIIRKAQSSNRFVRILKIFNLPGWADMPPKIRHTMNYWIHVHKKGYGVMKLVVSKEGPEQKPLQFYTYNIAKVSWVALPSEVYDLYLKIKSEVELRRFQEGAMKTQDIQFKKLPVAQKRKILAELILKLREKYGDQIVEEYVTSEGEAKRRLRWSFLAAKMAKEFKINVSNSALRAYFKEFKDLGWEFIEEIANL